MDDSISIDAAIRWLDIKSGDIYDQVFYEYDAPEWEDYEYEALLMAIEALKQQKTMSKNKDRILQAGKEGREIKFWIGGRLFAIRELAQ